ncbi:MAG TPA: Holliday junction branch migration protein RuvA, partial [Clostridiales bacterium]|nr:Holliday junction branch migration protein RuvA [Clostridiales bacterium]
MIAYVKGKVLSASNGTVILERDGLGFEIICSATSFKRLVEE